MYKEITSCRICGNTGLVKVLDLGKHALSGVFPSRKEDVVPEGPLEIVKCVSDSGGRHCGLLQLKHDYELGLMYGDNYGYRSGLNASMVKHLNDLVGKLLAFMSVERGDVVLDIGSNDGTLLRAYPESKRLLPVGMDPTASKFKEYYRGDAIVSSCFFSAAEFKKIAGSKKAKIITSIAMFYDLQSPLDFMKDVYESLADDGVWISEQSYMPSMLDAVAYDTICHEHLEYYSLSQICWMAERAGFRVINVDFNDTNGGSFCVWCVKKGTAKDDPEQIVRHVLAREKERALDAPGTYSVFADRVAGHGRELKGLVEKFSSEGKTVFGYGASTKGNTLLQYCGLGRDLIKYVADVNPYKFGRFTPKTLIPIISEDEAKALNPDLFLVLPWHFREFILRKEKKFIEQGGGLIFPLPKTEVLTCLK